MIIPLAPPFSGSVAVGDVDAGRVPLVTVKDITHPPPEQPAGLPLASTFAKIRSVDPLSASVVGEHVAVALVNTGPATGPPMLLLAMGMR